MSRIAISIQSPVNTLVLGNLPPQSTIQIHQQPDGQYIMHGDSTELKVLLKELRHQILLRKANARNLDSGTVEYYKTSLQTLQNAIYSVKHVESNLMDKP